MTLIGLGGFHYKTHAEHALTPQTIDRTSGQITPGTTDPHGSSLRTSELEGWYRFRLLEAPVQHGTHQMRSPIRAFPKADDQAIVRLMAYWPASPKALASNGMPAPPGGTLDPSGLSLGTQGIARLHPEPARKPQGAWDFDMAAWYRSSGLAGQTHLPAAVWRACADERPWWSLRKGLESVRQRAIAACYRHMTKSSVPRIGQRPRAEGTHGAQSSARPSKDKTPHALPKWNSADLKASILAAMALGWKSGLDADAKRAFSASGTMHILAVSGLHVGMLSLWAERVLNAGTRSLLWLLSCLRLHRPRTGHWMLKAQPLRYLESAVLVALVWGYAVFTGAAPSVTRAAVFFTFWRGGACLDRKGSAWNAWFAALWVLMLWQPWTPDALGAQLSFAAVAGILSFYARFRESLPLNGRLGHIMADAMALSLAAQLGTWALAWHRFGQFPPWFLLGNLCALPVAFLALPGTALLLAFGEIPYLGPSVRWGLDLLLEVWLWCSMRTQQLPQWFQTGLSAPLFAAAVLHGLGLMHHPLASKTSGGKWVLPQANWFHKRWSKAQWIFSLCLVCLVAFQQHALFGHERKRMAVESWSWFGRSKTMLVHGRHATSILPEGASNASPQSGPYWPKAAVSIPNALEGHRLEGRYRDGIPAWSWYIPGGGCLLEGLPFNPRFVWPEAFDSRHPGG